MVDANGVWGYNACLGLTTCRSVVPDGTEVLGPCKEIVCYVRMQLAANRESERSSLVQCILSHNSNRHPG